MALNTQAIVDAVASHAAASGHFERVQGHEVVSAPGHGLTAAVWIDQIDPAPGMSGLAATSIRLGLLVRIYTPVNQEPRDLIDPTVMAAADALMAAYSGDFTLGGLVTQVDLLGAHGVPLRARAGYTRVQEGAQYRVMTIDLPVIAADVWAQAP